MKEGAAGSCEHTAHNGNRRSNKLKFKHGSKLFIRMHSEPISSWGIVVECPRPVGTSRAHAGDDLGMAWMISEDFSQLYITTIP